MTILELYTQWTAEEKKQALAAMPRLRLLKLGSALRAAGWTLSDLRAAGLTPSALRAAGLTLSALRAAGWTPSALRAAGWTPSALRAAGWTLSALRAAGWTPSALRAAGWTLSDLESSENEAKNDIQDKARKMGRDEAEFVVRELKLGLMNGVSYGTLDSCGCYLGSAAKKAGMSVEKFCVLRGIKADGSSPAESWFMAVRVGDTPENNYAAEMGVKWIEEVLAETESTGKAVQP